MKTANDLQSWTNLVVKLKPLEQLALIGLIDQYPDLTAPSIDVSRIVGEEKCNRASTWLNKHFRDLLYCYCDFCSKIAIRVGGESADITPLIPALVTLLMCVKGVTMAPAVAFAAWALQAEIKLWCKQYGRVYLDGKGAYIIDPYFNYSGDFPNYEPIQTLEGAYSVISYPAIKEVVRDRRYRDKRHKINIEQPARAEGHFTPSSLSSMAVIAHYCHPNHQHRFSFLDTIKERSVEGIISMDHLRACPSDRNLTFVAEPVTLNDRA